MFFCKIFLILVSFLFITEACQKTSDHDLKMSQHFQGRKNMRTNANDASKTSDKGFRKFNSSGDGPMRKNDVKGWSYGSWSPCSVPCGRPRSGTRTRTRVCNRRRGCGRFRRGHKEVQSQRCPLIYKKCQGEWTEWTEWSSKDCTLDCGSSRSGMMKRKRYCGGPAVMNGRDYYCNQGPSNIVPAGTRDEDKHPCPMPTPCKDEEEPLSSKEEMDEEEESTEPESGVRIVRKGSWVWKVQVTTDPRTGMVSRQVQVIGQGGGQGWQLDEDDFRDLDWETKNMIERMERRLRERG